MLLGLATVACSRSAFVPFPDPQDAKTAVFLALARDGSVKSQAEEISSTFRFQLDRDRDQAFLLLYQKELFALGLGPGAPLPASPNCGLLAPMRTLRLDGDRWTVIELDEDLKRALIPDRAARCGACPTARRSTMQMAPAGVYRVRPAAPFSATQLFGIGSDGRALLMARDRAEVLTGWSGPASGIIALEHQQYWIAQGRTLVRVSVDPLSLKVGIIDVLDVPTRGEPPHTEEARWIAGDPAGGELYVLTSTGTLLGYVGGAWSTLGDLPRHHRLAPGEPTEDGGLVWLGPEQVAATAGENEVSWFVGGTRTRREQVPVILTTHATTALGRVGDGSVAAGTGGGTVIKFGPSGPGEVLIAVQSSDEVGSVVPYKTGFFAGSHSGAILEWFPETGFCPEPIRVAATEYRPQYAYVDAGGALVVPDMEMYQVLWFDELF
ncbi:MAG: hypothetical protein U1E65_29605 [Myxococcota bacterium]